MVKRRVTPDSDDEGSDAGTPAPKRARTAESDQSGARPTRANGKSATKAKDESDDSDVDMGGEEGGEDDDEQFEQQYTDQVMAAMASKRHLAGGIAEHGIIESIEMHQFMCHKYLTFSFGPQINFIIGHNGSGKSAVLSAITVALGGKATATGRANGLKSFIREGQAVSEVTIQIKNQGEEAYKPKEYGKSIVITRRFTKDGSTTWKIKSREGKTISSKKEELAAICDHMNIQVDNPMNVLTQDAARQFLSASSPAEMYKFFLKGTQLSQLAEEYQTCIENVDHTAKILNQKKDVIPDLRNAYNEAVSRYREAEKARDQKAKVDELKKELAWAFVNTKERELAQACDEVARQERRLPKVQENLDSAQALFASTSDEVVRVNAVYENMPDVEHLTAERKELNEKMRRVKGQLNELLNERRQMNTTYQAAKDTITMIQQQIDEEAHKMASDTQAKRDSHTRRLEAVMEHQRQAKEALPGIIEKIREIEEDAKIIHSKGETLQAELKTAQDGVMHAQNMISQANELERNRYAAYGRGIQQLLERIKNSKWHGDIPTGPLGIHVKCREPEKWGDLLRSQLGGLLTAFAVTDSRDAPTLRNMLKQTGNEHLLVIISQKDMFDYSSGEPPEDMLTVLRALEISDPYVLRVLINQQNIERIFLARTRRDGEDTLRHYGRAGQAWTGDGFLMRRFPEGGESNSPLNQRRNDSTSTLLTGRDANAQRQYYQNELQDKERQVKMLNHEIRELKARYMKNKTEVDKQKALERKAHEDISRDKATQQQLELVAAEDMPANIAGLEASKRESEEEKENIETQFADHTTRQTELQTELEALKVKAADVRTQIEEHESRRRELQDTMEKAAERRTKAQHELRYMEKKLEEETNSLTRLKDKSDVLQKEFETWTASAEEYCPKVVTRRSKEEIQKVLDSTQSALKEREKRQGATVEELMVQLNKAKLALDTVGSEYKHMVLLNKQLKKSLMTRLQRWQEFRRHIALRCKFAFQFNLSHRGYYGKVIFDHAKETLSLKVQTEDVAMTQAGARDKDPRSLSGGEKSFATISLLLALWEAIGCPLRCLDEFDVFMDAVNRRISMKMMIDTANASDKKQYVLITPQDMNNIQVGNSVRVHRMTDPERGQGTLAFNG